MGVAMMNSNSTPKVRCCGGEEGAWRAERILVDGNEDEIAD